VAQSPRPGAHSRSAAKVTTVEFDSFASARLDEEAASQGVTVEELVRHAVMYYLADLDSGRPATRATPAAGGGSAAPVDEQAPP
jgi:hypothetical protein